MSKASNLLTQLRQNEEDNPAGEPSYGTPEKPKNVDGGIIYNQQINPAEYKQMTNRMQLITSVRHRKWSAIFNIFRDPNSNGYQMFVLFFEPDDINSGNIAVERAQRLKVIGSFNSKDAAVKYLTGNKPLFGFGTGDGHGGNDRSPLVGKRDSPWTAQELGVGRTFTNRSGALKPGSEQ